MERVIDATDLILGRMCSYLAKRLILGDKIKLVNCEKAVLSGSKQDILNKYQARRIRGQPTKGVFYPRRPDMFLKRIMRGMLPYKREKGREALSRLICFMGVPEELKDKKIETVKEASMLKLPKSTKVTINDICKHLGGRT